MRPVHRCRAALLALAAWAGAGCHSLVDPPLPSGAVPLTPPAVYARWWTMTEACSGLSRDMRDITWYVVPGAAQFPNGGREANGYYSRAGPEIVLAGQVQLDAAVVRHEMLHALLRDQPGHPRDQFLDRCAGLVVCADACVADAGAAPAPPAGTRIVPASALQITAELSAAAPSGSRDDGWFTLTVTATNPATTSVLVAPSPASGDARFRYEVAPAPTLAGEATTYDARGRLFAPGETKRHVFDFHVGQERGLGDVALPAGRYTFRGAFGAWDVGPWSPPVAAALSP